MRWITRLDMLPAGCTAAAYATTTDDATLPLF
jgi:hypothetical protein